MLERRTANRRDTKHDEPGDERELRALLFREFRFSGRNPVIASVPRLKC